MIFNVGNFLLGLFGALAGLFLIPFLLVGLMFLVVLAIRGMVD